MSESENFSTRVSQSDELERLRAAATRFRREATLVERTSETTLIQWPSAEVDAFIAVFPISEDFPTALGGIYETEDGIMMHTSGCPVLTSEEMDELIAGAIDD